MKYTVSDLTDTELNKLSASVYAEKRLRETNRKLYSIRAKLKRENERIRVYAVFEDGDPAEKYTFTLVKGKVESELYIALGGQWDVVQEYVPPGFLEEETGGCYGFNGSPTEARKILKSIDARVFSGYPRF